MEKSVDNLSIELSRAPNRYDSRSSGDSSRMTHDCWPQQSQKVSEPMFCFKSSARLFASRAAPGSRAVARREARRRAGGYSRAAPEAARRRSPSPLDSPGGRERFGLIGRQNKAQEDYGTEPNISTPVSWQLRRRHNDHKIINSDIRLRRATSLPFGPPRRARSCPHRGGLVSA
jgi:hypothetical protein